jgi:hypothetical protein
MASRFHSFVDIRTAKEKADASSAYWCDRLNREWEARCKRCDRQRIQVDDNVMTADEMQVHLRTGMCIFCIHAPRNMHALPSWINARTRYGSLGRGTNTASTTDVAADDDKDADDKDDDDDNESDDDDDAASDRDASEDDDIVMLVPIGDIDDSVICN